MRRREFVTLAGGAAAAWPLAARAQRPPLPVIGFLHSASRDAHVLYLTAFYRGLSETGHVEGRDVLIEHRWADGHYDRLPDLAADLVRRQVAVIVAGGSATPPVAKAATTTIPIVFSTALDPVAAGLVASLSRPGGNLTGVTGLNVEVVPKLLEMLHELVTTATNIALLVNPGTPAAEPLVNDLQAAARVLGVQLLILNAGTDREIDEAFATMTRMRAGALVIATDVFFNSRIELLAARALRHAIPTIYQYREFAVAGGLMSYGNSLIDQYRIVGTYAGRILKGEKPADLPVQRATKIELIINMKTAKALNLTFPITLLGRADEAIE